MAFDCITAWEVLEHLAEPDLPGLCDNLHAHLAPAGIFIASVCPHGDGPEGVELHQTVRPRAWWEAFFTEQGFRLDPDLVRWFGNDWIRGPQQGAPGSFHLILSL